MAQIKPKLLEINKVTFKNSATGETKDLNMVNFDDACKWAKRFNLSVPALPYGVASCKVERTSGYATWSVPAVISNLGTDADANVPVFYNDVLAVTATARPGFNAPILSWTTKTVTEDITLQVTSGAAKGITLNYPAMPTGVQSFHISCLKSPSGNTQLGPLFNNPTQAGSVTVYPGDELGAEVMGASGYSAPTYSWDTYTVGTLNINFSLTAGIPLTYTITLPAHGPHIGSVVVKNGSTTVATGKQSETVYFTANYGDVLTLEMTAAPGYHNPTYTKTWTVTSAFTFSWTEGNVIEYRLTKTTSGSGVASHVVSRTDSPIGGGSIGTLEDTAIIYYNDKLTASASAETPYNAPSINWTSMTVSGNVESKVTGGSVKSTKLVCNTVPTGVSSYTVTRTSSPYGKASTGTIENNATLYYGDVLTISAVATTGYYAPTATLSQTTVTNTNVNVTASVTAGGVKQFKLTKSTGIGVASHTVTRTSSPLQGAGSTISNGVIYYGDVLSASASPEAPYVNASVDWTSKTVTADVTSTATKGAVKTFKFNYPAKPVWCSEFQIIRASSEYQGATTGLVTSLGSSAGSTTFYYGDTVVFEWTNAPGFNDPTLSASEYYITSENTLTIGANPKSYKLSYPVRGTGVGTYKITRVTSPYKGLAANTVIVDSPTTAGSTTVYHGDTLSISATAVTGYLDPTCSLSSTTVKSDVTATVTRGKKWASLTINKCTQADTHNVVRSGVSLASGTTVYEGDVLYAEVTAQAPYNQPTLNWSNYTVSSTDSAIASTSTNAGVKTFTFKKITGSNVATHIVTRTESPYGGISKGPLANGDTIYYGDKLTAAATPAAAYSSVNLNWTSKTVTGATTSEASVDTSLVKSFTLTYPKTPAGVYSWVIARTSSPYKGATVGPLVTTPSSSGSVTVYYGDTLEVEASENTGFNAPSKSFTTTTVTSDINFTLTHNPKSFTLTLPALPTGVSAYTVSRTATYATGNWTSASGSSSQQTKTIYYGDKLSISGTASTGFNAAITSITSPVTGNITASVSSGGPITSVLTISKCTQAASHTVTRTSSPYKGAGSTITNGIIYYGDVLSASVTAQAPYNTPTLNWSTYTVGTSNVTSTSTNAGVKSFKLTLSTGNQVDTHVVKRTASQYQGATTGTLTNGATIYYGDTLTASATAKTGYNSPTLNWTSLTVDGNETSTASNGGVRAYLLTISKGAGVNTHTVTRTSSPLGGGATGTLSSGSTIYYNDVLTASATADAAYNAPSLNWTSKTVTSDVTSTSTGGSLKSYTWNYPAKPTGISTYIIVRTSSPYKGATCGEIVNSPTSAGSFTAYYGDTFETEIAAANGFKNASITLPSANTSGTVSVSVEPQSYTLTISTPTYVSHTVKRTGSPYKGAATGTLSNGATIYYGDTLTASASSTNDAYNAPSLNWTSLTVASSTTSTATRGAVKSYTLTINVATQAASHTVKRTESPYGGGSIGNLSNGATIYHGDKLTASVTAKTGYSTPSLNWTSLTVDGNETSTSSNQGALKYTLTISKCSQASSHTVSRTSSPYEGASTGSLSNGATIYYGDKLSASVSASTGYNTPSLNWSSLTVDGNETSTSTNQGAKTYSVSITSPSASVSVSGTNSSNSYVTHFDSVKITATPYTGYKLDSIYANGSSISNGGSVTISGPLTISVNCTALTGTLTYPATPTGCTYAVLKNSGSSGWTSVVSSPSSSGSKSIDVGTELMVTYSASTGYNSPTVKVNGSSVSDGHTFTMSGDGAVINVSAGSAKSYTLSYPAKPSGVSTYTITRNGSSFVSSPSSSGSKTIYHGDSLSISASAATNYSSPTYKFNNGSTSITVTGNVTATVTAGSYSPPVSNNITFTMDGASFTVSKGTRWCDLGTTLGYRLYEDTTSGGLVTPNGGSGSGPWVIDSVAGEPVMWTDSIINGRSYFMSG